MSKATLLGRSLMAPIRFRIRTLMIVIAVVAVLMALGPILVNLDPGFVLRSFIVVLLLALFVSWLVASLALWVALAAFATAYLFGRMRTTLGILRASSSPEPDPTTDAQRG